MQREEWNHGLSNSRVWGSIKETHCHQAKVFLLHLTCDRESSESLRATLVLSLVKSPNLTLS